MPVLRFPLPTVIDNVGVVAYEIWGSDLNWPNPDGRILLLRFAVEGSDRVLRFYGPASYRDFGTRNPRLYRLCVNVGEDWQKARLWFAERFGT